MQYSFLQEVKKHFQEPRQNNLCFCAHECSVHWGEFNINVAFSRSPPTLAVSTNYVDTKRWLVSPKMSTFVNIYKVENVNAGGSSSSVDIQFGRFVSKKYFEGVI